MNPCPKEKTFKSEKYKQYIRSLPCIICDYPCSEPHHVRNANNSGTGKKPSDFWCVPLCKLHHAEFHHYGKKTFYDRHGIDIYEVLFMTVKGFVEKEIS